MAGDEASRYLAKSLYNHGFANELQRASEDRIEPFLREAIELDPTYTDAMSCLGTLCLRTGRVDEGLGWLGKCTELDPGAGQGWYYQAKHHLGAKDSEKAAYFAGRAGDAYHAARQYQFEGDARDIEGFAYRDLGKLR
ncbi:MAG: hypothetical protein H5U40_15325, partial [Polyangiaceae bacterium]|nr:hypothetical protein [Polyangiaceae bacterium]